MTGERMPGAGGRRLPMLDAAEARARADDVSLTQNGLWLNWARFGDRSALERGLRRCEDIALGRS